MSRLDRESIHPSFILHKNIDWALCLWSIMPVFFKDPLVPKRSTNGELLMTYSVLSEIFSPFLIQSLPLCWGNLTSADWRTSKCLCRGSSSLGGDSGWGLPGPSAFPRCARGPFLSELRPLCVSPYRMTTQMPESKMETSLSSSSPRKLL